MPGDLPGISRISEIPLFVDRSLVAPDIFRVYVPGIGQLTGRLSKARNATPLQDEELVEIGHFAKSSKSPQSRERVKVQWLGDIPKVNRATAMWPDEFHVADARAKFKKPRSKIAASLVRQKGRRLTPLNNLLTEIRKSRRSRISIFGL